MSTPELVTITIDGRELHVPKGHGIVETALQAGIEIPVFCYEPRLGPAVGACRMCLCEVEGMPKLQAACTMSAQDGMIVRTSATSEKAAGGQNAVLEFILLNHPLDCPDCDKGGECPLQDLTFRFGPGKTRMQFPKRTFDKPIPISPTIALDRERCILCYRCTRFSEGIAEDGQLVAKNRGANSIIATFEDEPYRAHFSGNVTELCPVGALLPTTYRFRARPWEIDNVPTVCGLCPVGCNTWVTTREGKPVRVLSRNHPEIDDGWLCDKGRFAFDHLRAEDRIREPLLRVRRRGFEKITWDQAVDEAERGLRDAEGPVVLALSGGETTEQARGLAQLVRQGLGSDVAILPDDLDPALDAFRAPISAIRDANVVLVVGDEPVVERAPVVDLWLRAARRDGAEILYATPDGNVPTAPGSAAAVCASPPAEIAEKLQGAERVALVWSQGAKDGCRALAALAGSLPGHVAAYALPRTPNGRGVAEAWYAAGEGRGSEPPADGELGALIVSGDEAAYDPRVAELAGRARFVLATSMFMGEGTLQAHVVLPGTSYLERDGTVTNLEGRRQRQRKAVEPPGWTELEFVSRLAERFGLAVPAWASELPSERAALDPPAEAEPVAAPKPARAAKANGRGLQLVSFRPCFSGGAVERVEALQFQRPEGEVELSRADADRLGVATGDTVSVGTNGTSRELRARVNRRLLAGAVRIAEEHSAGLEGAVEVRRT
ncbi:MAG TPA: molybdopterin-dependent oxidoreductase [Gaiellaceae bacterium]